MDCWHPEQKCQSACLDQVIFLAAVVGLYFLVFDRYKRKKHWFDLKRKLGLSRRADYNLTRGGLGSAANDPRRG